MSEDTKTIIGTGSKISITLLVIIVSPLVWLISLTYELRAEIVALKSDVAFMRLNSWTISDMERYRFAAQIANASIGAKVPDVQEIVRQRPK